jgi:hypothetical protein
VQAQDYLAAKWAVGLRLLHGTDDLIERALDNGSILRTHVMRPTWHFVTPADIRWMLALTAPRLRAATATYYRTLELDNKVLSRSIDVITRSLQGGKALARSELAVILQGHGIDVRNSMRLGSIILHLEFAGAICSGGRRGKQFTYALLDERVPPSRVLEREEALSLLIRRYFTSHGPATLKDFAWWSGLTTTDAKAGLGMVKHDLVQETADEETHWFSPKPSCTKVSSTQVLLLPNFDEYAVGYADRSMIFDVSHTAKLDSRASPIAQHTIVVDGKIAGTWKRVIKKDSVTLAPKLFATITMAQNRALAKAAAGYAKFLGVPAIV